MKHRYTLIAYRSSGHDYCTHYPSDLSILTYEHDELDALIRMVVCFDRQNHERPMDCKYELTVLLDGLEIEEEILPDEGENEKENHQRREMLTGYKTALAAALATVKAEREAEAERKRAEEAKRRQIAEDQQRERDLQTLRHLKAKYETT